MYVTLAEVKTLLARVLAPYESAGTVDDTHLQLIIDAAEGMVNAAVCSRYTIPVAETEAVNYLKALIIPIVRYKTFTQFAEQEDFPDGVLEEYKATMKSLDNLAKRVTSLPNESDKATGRAASIKISTADSPIAGF